MQSICFLRCRRAIESGAKSVAVYMFGANRWSKDTAKIWGKSDLLLSAVCSPLAEGLPPEGALNMVAWEMIRELVSADPSLNEAAC